MSHPYDDEFPSSEPQPPRLPVIALAQNDEFPSSSGEFMINQNDSNQGAGVGALRRIDGGATSSPATQQEAAVPNANRYGAEPFSTENYLPFPARLGGPDAESNRYSTDREVGPYHIGKVVQKASIQFNADLIRAAELTAEEKQSVDSMMTRKQKCAKIVDIWLRKGNSPKILFDLKLLLTKAGEPDNKYEALIRDVLHTRVT